ncbi:hypothetical protein RBSWK_02595 [Rhodopirellula baltica SWK14]|uniref:Uncharacterized protein n=1 Tax=Rhodopirellula baltica SWK14 TaxID=993516 RepID=L7CI47_RHOBT|nr:hypothetical protein RBSWK_02595 [Rhodopirellula baltica SWK14]
MDSQSNLHRYPSLRKPNARFNAVVRYLDGQTWFLPMQKKGQPRPFCFAKSELQATLQPCLPLILL